MVVGRRCWGIFSRSSDGMMYDGEHASSMGADCVKEKYCSIRVRTTAV